MLLFAVGLLLPNCDMPRKELNPPCISEQVGEWKCREQENVYGICKGADRRSARKPKYWGYVLAHHPGILPPSLCRHSFLIIRSDLRPDTHCIVHVSKNACQQGSPRWRQQDVWNTAKEWELGEPGAAEQQHQPFCMRPRSHRELKLVDAEGWGGRGGRWLQKEHEERWQADRCCLKILVLRSKASPMSYLGV